MPPKKEEKRVDAAPRANFGTFDSVAAEDKKSGSRFMMIGVVAVLVIAAASTFAFLKMQKPKTAAPQQTQEAANVPPASLPPSGNAQPVSSASSTSAPAALQHDCDACGYKVCSGEAIGEDGCREKFVAGRKACCRGEAGVSRHFGSTGASKIAKQNIAQAAPDVAPSFTADTANYVSAFIQSGAARSILSTISSGD